MWFDNRNGIRKRLTLLIMTVVCVLAAAFPAALRADALGSAKLKADVCEAEGGDTVEIVFTLEQNPGIWGLKFRVDYDHAALALQSVTPGGVFSGSEITWPEENGTSQRYVFLGCSDQLENKTQNGGILTLMFSVAEGAPEGEYPVALEVVQAINAAGEDVKIAVQNGAVSVKESEPAGGDEDEEQKTVVETNDQKTAQGSQTGDSSNPALWLALELLSAGAMAAMILSRNSVRR